MFKFEEIKGIKKEDEICEIESLDNKILLIFETLRDTIKKINAMGFDKNLFANIRDGKINDYYKYFFYDSKGDEGFVMAWRDFRMMIDNCVFDLWNQEIEFYKEFKPKDAMKGQIEVKFLEDRVLVRDNASDMNIKLPKIIREISRLLQIEIDDNKNSKEQLIDLISEASKKGIFMVDLTKMEIMPIQVVDGVRIEDSLGNSVISYDEHDVEFVRTRKKN